MSNPFLHLFYTCLSQTSGVPNLKLPTRLLTSTLLWANYDYLSQLWQWLQFYTPSLALALLAQFPTLLLSSVHTCSGHVSWAPTYRFTKYKHWAVRSVSSLIMTCITLALLSSPKSLESLSRLKNETKPQNSQTKTNTKLPRMRWEQII